eukprot:scaffold149883_cov35-Tisochrysis_lutea.AAC.1
MPASAPGRAVYDYAAHDAAVIADGQNDEESDGHHDGEIEKGQIETDHREGLGHLGARRHHTITHGEHVALHSRTHANVTTQPEQRVWGSRRVGQQRHRNSTVKSPKAAGESRPIDPSPRKKPRLARPFPARAFPRSAVTGGRIGPAHTCERASRVEWFGQLSVTGRPHVNGETYFKESSNQRS